MKKNARKPTAENASDAGRKPDVECSDDQARARTTKNPLRPVREDSENLRQRAEWFSHRRGEK
jgi:hypothetical protein